DAVNGARRLCRGESRSALELLRFAAGLNLKSCSLIRAARFGQKGTPARGPFQRGWSNRATSWSRPPSVNLPKKQILSLKARWSSSRLWRKKAGNSCTLSRLKQTSTLHNSRAIHLRLSGRLDPADDKVFLKSTES